MASQPHRNLIVMAACLLGLAAGEADAAVVALAAPRDGLRAELDERAGHD